MMQPNSQGETMKLKPLASNMTELTIGTNRILFSYETPVACIDDATNEYYATDKKWSVTTSRHINKFLGTTRAAYKANSDIARPQEFFDNLISEVK